MVDTRKVRFNVAIAGHRPGQIVNYAEMPDGQKFWVDNESILQRDRICEFFEPKPDLDAEIKKVIEQPAKEPEITSDITEEPVVEKKEEIDESTPTESEKDSPVVGKRYNFDFDTIGKPLCKGTKSDGSPCKRDKLSENGYCFQHQPDK